MAVISKTNFPVDIPLGVNAGLKLIRSEDSLEVELLKDLSSVWKNSYPLDRQGKTLSERAIVQICAEVRTHEVSLSPERVRKFLDTSYFSPLVKTLKEKIDGLNDLQKVGSLLALAKCTRNPHNHERTKSAYQTANLHFGLPDGDGFNLEKTDGYKERLCELRSDAFKQTLENDADVKKIYKDVSDAYLKLAQDLIVDALEYLPIPDDCSYTFVALGSLAREEQTPYSDLEFAIIVSRDLSQEERDQFIKISEWIHFQILLLGETPLAELDIEGIDDRTLTRKGFTVDGPVGKMTPVWSPHLIDTLKKLVLLQSNEEFIKRYTFPGELRNFSFIHGSRDLCHNYRTLLKAHPSEEQRRARALQILILDGDRFAVTGGKTETIGRVLPVKYELYRAIQLRIEGLALYFGLSEQNIFERLKALERLGLFSENGANNLTKAASEILKLRSLQYLENHFASEEAPVNIEEYTHIYKTLIPFEQAVESFAYSGDLYALKDDFEYSEDACKGIVCGTIGRYSDACNLLEQEIKRELPAHLKLDLSLRLSRFCTESMNFSRALELTHQVKDDIKKEKIQGWQKICFGVGALINRSATWSRMMDFTQAISDANTALTTIQNEGAINTYTEMILYSNLGNLFSEAGNHSKGIELFNKALQGEAIYCNQPQRRALILYNRGEAHTQLGEYQEAQEDFEEVLRIIPRVAGSSDILVAHAQKGIALIYGFRNASPEDKKQCYDSHKEALKTYETCNREVDQEFFTQYCNLGVSASALGKKDETESYFKQAKTLFEKVPDVRHITFYSMRGNAFRNLGEYQKSACDYKGALDLWEEKKEALKIEAPHLSAFRSHNYAHSLSDWGCQLTAEGKFTLARRVLQKSESQFIEASCFHKKNPPTANSKKTREAYKDLKRNLKKLNKKINKKRI